MEGNSKKASDNHCHWKPLPLEVAQDLIKTTITSSDCEAIMTSNKLPLPSHPHTQTARNSILFVVIPYRDREGQLEITLKELTAYFDAIFAGIEDFAYFFVVVEQADDRPFNRGVLFNVSALYVEKVLSELLHEMRNEPSKTAYICFHDADIVPRGRHFDFDYCGNEPCHYYCPQKQHVLHLYGHTWSLGGIFSIRFDDFISTKGFSNYFWGWGWEDCDFQHRCEKSNLIIDRSKFSERLTGAASFRELDKIPIDLHTVLAEHLESEEALKNKWIYFDKLNEKFISEGLKEVQSAMLLGGIRAHSLFLECKNYSVSLFHGSLEADEFSLKMRRQCKEKLHWVKVHIAEPFQYIGVV